ncbi:jg61, partial [Pararge aegeria aegeria]
VEDGAAASLVGGSCGGSAHYSRNRCLVRNSIKVNVRDRTSL